VKRFCILLTCDRAYLQPARFVASQISSFASDNTDVIICSGEALGVSDRSYVEHRQINVPNFIKHLPTNERLREFAYWRIPAIDLLVQSYERILYLDTDIFLNCAGVQALFDLNMNGHALAAVLDVHQTVRPNRAVAEYQALGLAHSPYFNSGVLLVDSAAWQKRSSLEQMKELCDAHGDQLFRHDQSLLNLAFKDDWLELSPVWNWQYSYRNSFLTEWASPRLIHFAGAHKLWSPPTGNIPRRYRDAYAEFITAQGGDGGVVLADDEPSELPRQFKTLFKNLWYFRAISKDISRFPHALSTISHRADRSN
jgi:lipopolysaccharide biosynthesis glycosyltransferase